MSRPRPSPRSWSHVRVPAHRAWPALALLLAAVAADPAAAQGRGRPGDFDLWVLSLSWSPSYCEATGNARGDAQCARPFSFVVHGLWPQYERGYPSDCDARVAPPTREQIRDMLDVMPSPGLINHEWRKHGTCSGLSPTDYFAAVKAARDRVVVPPEFRQPGGDKTTTALDLERAFVAANPGLRIDMMGVSCRGEVLQEVRVCMSRDLRGFVPCGEVDRRGCRARTISVPAPR